MKKCYSLWLQRLGLLWLAYTVCRFFFWYFNRDTFQQASFQEIGRSFLLGIRFDWSIIALSNILFTLLSLLPLRWVATTTWQRVLKTVYLAVNLPLLLLNLIDAEYYPFTGRRTIISLLDLGGDITDQLPSLVVHFWYLLLIFAGITYVLVRFYPNRKPVETSSRVAWWPGWAGLAFALALSILLFRGGFQEKPLRANQAFRQNDAGLGNLTLNSSFTFLTSIDAVGTERLAFFTDQKTAWSLICHPSPTPLHLPVQPPQNVVVIILESFAKEYMGYGNPYRGYTPFLDSLARQSVFFTNGFANGRESIMAVPAVTASIPQLMDEPFITSTYQSNRFSGLGTLLHRHGFQTHFFHAARNGSMGFEGFSQQAGFQNYYGLNEYPDSLRERDFDGNWGIFDEPYLQYVSGQLSQSKQPFGAVLFTLSSHMPYTIPAQYKNRFPKGKVEVHESIGYADYALREFFKTAQKQPWFRQTLFVITADHTQETTEPGYANPLGAYRVPILLFHADPQVVQALKQQTDTDRICQHTDLMPTVLHYLNLNENPVLPFGQSVFDTEPGQAVQYAAGRFRLVEKDVYLEMPLDGTGVLYDSRTDQPIRNEVRRHQLQQRLQATLQAYRNGLIDNRFLDPNAGEKPLAVR
ncbi:LTA synthase family protein [Larkinella rosea]|uniref:Alkaline phosphatase family protein n=1 Tax=Larkinella rosea TaxID=2025312 RepID=A0A3P1BE19_9BACT|nr:alkaline phosphatase family protein [Larkinella rosea]RRA99165.1 alkaline phosphatase family protein [Larkinella rosea]